MTTYFIICLNFKSLCFTYMQAALTTIVMQHFVFALVSLILTFSSDTTLSLITSVGPSTNTKKLFFRLSERDD